MSSEGDAPTFISPIKTTPFSATLALPRLHRLLVAVAFLLPLAGTARAATNFWQGTTTNGTSTANWSLGALPTNTADTMTMEQSGSLSATVDMGATNITVTNLVVTNFSGNVVLTNVRDFRLYSTTAAALSANGAAGSTLYIYNSQASSAAILSSSTAQTFGGNMSVYLDRFVTHTTTARILTQNLTNFTINNFLINPNSALPNATTTFQGTGTTTIAGVISQSTNANPNPYMISVNSGTVNITGTNNSASWRNGLLIKNGGSVYIADQGSLGGTGDLLLQGTTTATGTFGLTAGSLAAVALSNNLVISNSSSSVVQSIVAGTGKTLTINGVISSANTNGTLIFGAGKVVLAGSNTYNMAATVIAGSLIINGNQSGATNVLTVAAGATLGGSGTNGGATTISGVLAPGTASAR